MKKFLSLVLVLCMALSMLVLPTFAAEENAGAADSDAKDVATAEEFLAMEATGSYKLTADITLDTSYEAGFTGTFDGQGHTVTTSVPMFKDFGGTAKNFIVKGNVTGAAAVAAASTCAASGSTVVFENIVSYAKVTSDGRGAALIALFGSNEADYGASLKITNCENKGNITAAKEAGGLVGAAYFSKDASLATDAGAVLTNCVNKGTILSTGGMAGGIFARPMYCKTAVKIVGCVNNGDVTGKNNTGGITGHTTNAIFFASYCINTGNVESTNTGKGTDRYAGGIIGYAQGIKLADYAASKGGVANLIEYCLNTGTVTAQTNTAGIAAHTGANGTYGLSHVKNCVNTGDVVAAENGDSQANNCASGIVAYSYGSPSNANQATKIENCVTTGNITISGDAGTKGTASYFLGYCSSKAVEIENNIASGTLTSSGTVYAFGWNNKSTFVSVKGNKLPEGCTYDLAYENGTTTKTADAKDGYKWANSEITDATWSTYLDNFNNSYSKATGDDDRLLYRKSDGTFFTKFADNMPLTGDNTLIMIVMFVVAAVAVVALLPKKRTER